MATAMRDGLKCDEPWCRHEVVWVIRLGDSALPKWEATRRVCITHARNVKRDVEAGDTSPTRVIVATTAVVPLWADL